jgi:hypothetical protein
MITFQDGTKQRIQTTIAVRDLDSDGTMPIAAE